jgi:hypothetical protein
VTGPLQIKSHSIESLRERFAAEGVRPYRADQIASWLYARGVEDPDAMTDLDAPLRERMRHEWSLSALAVERVDHSVDGTTKAALVASDGARIESVLIEYGYVRGSTNDSRAPGRTARAARPIKRRCGRSSRRRSKRAPRPCRSPVCANASRQVVWAATSSRSDRMARSIWRCAMSCAMRVAPG